MACCWRGAGAERWPWGHGERGLVWRGAWDCLWWMGGAVSMRRQTLGWSWRAGWAPGGCLCASDGRGGDFHQHSASPRVRRGRREKKIRQKAHGDHCAKRNQKQPYLCIWKITEEARDDPLPLPHIPSPTRPIYPIHHHHLVPSHPFTPAPSLEKQDHP